MFSPHYPGPENFDNATISGHFGFVFEENSGGGGEGGEGGNSHDYSDSIVFEKLMIVLVHNEMQSQRFQIPSVGRMFSESAVFVTD